LRVEGSSEKAGEKRPPGEGRREKVSRRRLRGEGRQEKASRRRPAGEGLLAKARPEKVLLTKARSEKVHQRRSWAKVWIEGLGRMLDDCFV
jgi:hypothetical protein